MRVCVCIFLCVCEKESVGYMCPCLTSVNQREDALYPRIFTTGYLSIYISSSFVFPFYLFSKCQYNFISHTTHTAHIRHPKQALFSLSFNITSPLDSFSFFSLLQTHTNEVSRDFWNWYSCSKKSHRIPSFYYQQLSFLKKKKMKKLFL